MRLLLVEDNDGDADLVRSSLEGTAEGAGIELTWTVRLDDAERRLKEKDFDVVLLDLALPDAIGFEGLYRLRANAPGVPVVVLTSLLDPTAGTRALQHGAQDYLQKWVEPSELLRALRYARERAQYAARARLLADVGVAVSSSLDPALVLSALYATVNRRYADWCAVDGADDERTRADAPAAPPRASVYPSLEDVPPGDAARPRLRDLAGRGFRSAMIAPFCVEGWANGAVTFARKPSAPAFDRADLAFAEEIAGRVGGALAYANLVVVARRERDRADVAGRLRDEFLATLSHELRTPLNAILGWTQMLRGGQVPPEKQGKALETIERNARSQVKLIEDVLDVSRIITGKLRINVGTVNLAEVLAAAFESVRPAAAAKGVALRLEPVGADTVQVDPERLLQILWNLLANAVKFTPRGGAVSVRVRRDAAGVEIAVSDTGQGMDAAFLPHAFERFRQADSTTSRGHGGLGLGLAITRHLVEAQGGTIAVDSDGVGRGATFTVRLPVAPPAPGAPAEGGATAAPDRGPATVGPVRGIAGLSILIVDDDDDGRSAVQTLLESWGARVATAASAEEALAELCATPPDLLVSDLGMPGTTGYDLIRRVRALPARLGRTPAVALTAYAGPEHRAKALALGFDHYVTKPVESTELLAVVGSLARRGLGR